MSSPSWSESLQASLSRLQPSERRPRVAVIGLGHPLRGDDAVGVVVARMLARLPGRGSPLLVIDAGFAPENQIGPLRKFQPDLVLLVDAAEMGEQPGAVRWLDWRETDGMSASTHTLPPSLLARFLVETIGCEVALLGVQPACDSLRAPLSPQVRQTARTVAQALAEIRQQCEG